MATGGLETTTGPLPIGQFVQFVQRTVKQDPMFQHQALVGEVSQWKVHNGNVYFTLRDDEGQMNCVIWRNARLTVDSSIKEGSQVIVIASLDLWPKRGNLQLVVVRIQPVKSVGELERIKRELIEALREEGALDAHRRSLPALPKHVAIVTGANSAALSDMKRLIQNRWPGLRTTVIGVLVQGEHAARSIVSAIGHEQDMLVTDLVADVRASTPSNAVERLVPDRHGVLMLLDDSHLRLQAAMQRTLHDQRQRVNLLKTQLKQAPSRGLNAASTRLERMKHAMHRHVARTLSVQHQRLEGYRNALSMAHPQRVLERGYVMAQHPSGEVVTSAGSLSIGQGITFQFADGSAQADVQRVDLKEDLE